MEGKEVIRELLKEPKVWLFLSFMCFFIGCVGYLSTPSWKDCLDKLISNFEFGELIEHALAFVFLFLSITCLIGAGTASLVNKSGN